MLSCRKGSILLMGQRFMTPIVRVYIDPLPFHTCGSVVAPRATTYTRVPPSVEWTLPIHNEDCI